MLRNAFRKIVTKLMVKRGYSHFYAWHVWQDQWDDLFHNSAFSWSQRIWAQKRGFLSNRISSYGLTEANYREYLSDFDCKKLHPINGFYSRWIDDKLTIRYLLDPFKDYLPDYYYQLNKGSVYSLPDLPSGYSADHQGIMVLLKKQGALAMKPMMGSRGEGFYKLSFVYDGFQINDKVAPREEVLGLLAQAENSLVTEYLRAHDDLSKIYPGSPNTVRILAIRPTDGELIFSNAHIRLGTSQSGVVDFTPSGGIYTNVDLDTGRYQECIRISGNQIEKLSVHPDTGARVKGILPHFDIIKEKLVEISTYLPQLKFMGYDIVVTRDSFKIVEINSHPMIGAQQHLYPMFQNKGSQKFFHDLMQAKKSGHR